MIYKFKDGLLGLALAFLSLSPSALFSEKLIVSNDKGVVLRSSGSTSGKPIEKLPPGVIVEFEEWYNSYKRVSLQRAGKKVFGYVWHTHLSPVVTSKPKMTQRIQEGLIELGYGVQHVDGVWGQNTENAVLAFKKSNGLPEVQFTDIALLNEILFAAYSSVIEEERVAQAESQKQEKLRDEISAADRLFRKGKCEEFSGFSRLARRGRSKQECIAAQKKRRGGSSLGHDFASGNAASAARGAALDTPVPAPIPDGSHVALVIGNAAYDHAARLANPLNDAGAVADRFSALGYDVLHVEDVDGSAFRIALARFSQMALGADIAVVFYAGHGIELDGRNYLIPVDARMESDVTARFETVALDDLASAAQLAGKLGLVLLDACRDNPFARDMARRDGTRSLSRGLAPVEVSRAGLLISFAAEAGATAADSAGGKHSPYTEALLRVLEDPELEVGRMFRRLRATVREATGGKQVPIERMQLPDEDVFLHRRRAG